MKEIWKIAMYVLIGILLFSANQCHRGKQSGLPPGTYTDTLIVFDTIPYPHPVSRDSVVIRYITQTLPAATAEPDTAQTDIEHSPIADVGRDSVEVEIPITQKVYETDRYRAVVSGYQPSLDDILIFQPTQVIRVKDKPKRWGVGVHAGYGVTIRGTPQFMPYIGVGVSYNLFQF